MFSSQPSDATVGGTLSPVVVQVLDGKGKPVGGSSFQVSLSLGNNPSGAGLSGTTSRQTVNGAAVFSDLSLDTPGVGVTLVARVNGFPDASSVPFDVSAGGCSAKPLSFNWSVTGDFSSAQCTSFGAPAIAVASSVPPHVAVRLTATATTFSPFINVSSPDGYEQTFVSGASSTISTKWLLVPATYTLSMGNFGGPVSGPYQFNGSLEAEQLSSCEVLYLDAPNTLTTSQSLSTSDCNDSGYWLDDYGLVESGPCTVTMRSTAFDAYLEVFDNTGALIAYDDDSGGGTDAQVTLSSCYSGSSGSILHGLRIRATSFVAGATGSYSLTVSSPYSTLSARPNGIRLLRGDLSTAAPRGPKPRHVKQR